MGSPYSLNIRWGAAISRRRLPNPATPYLRAPQQTHSAKHVQFYVGVAAVFFLSCVCTVYSPIYTSVAFQLSPLEWLYNWWCVEFIVWMYTAYVMDLNYWFMCHYVPAMCVCVTLDTLANEMFHLKGFSRRNILTNTIQFKSNKYFLTQWNISYIFLPLHVTNYVA